MKEQFGERLRAVRESRRLSLRATAAAVGISPGMLSQVELGQLFPSLSTLYSLVNYLEVSVDELLGLPESYRTQSAEEAVQHAHRDVLRQADAPTIESAKGVTWRRLADGGFEGVDALVVELQPGATTAVDGALERHAGLQFGVLVDGAAVMQIDFDEWLLVRGDSFAFESGRPHAFRNDGDSLARFVWFLLGRTDAVAANVLAREAARVTSVRSAVDVLRTMSALPPITLDSVDEAPRVS